MAEPTLTDYVHIVFTLFDKFVQHQPQNSSIKRGRPFTFAEKAMLVLFTLFQFRRIYQFKAQERWLKAHPELMGRLGWEQVPCRTTFSRRYKQLYQTLQPFVAFIGSDVSEQDPALSQKYLVEDKSLFKALGPVWHPSDRQEERIPRKLRHLDTDAT